MLAEMFGRPAGTKHRRLRHELAVLAVVTLAVELCIAELTWFMTVTS
jgi:hypothetical protein